MTAVQQQQQRPTIRWPWPRRRPMADRYPFNWAGRPEWPRNGYMLDPRK